ncbi:MAG: lamin tail domain-containing protein [bacterium]
MKPLLPATSGVGGGGTPRRAGGSAYAALCSALVCLFAVLPGSAPADVVINELMYHPDDGWHTNAAGTWVFVTNDTEYVEIHNAGTNAVDLSNYRFDNGITYGFPAGQVLATGAYLVVCQNIDAFKSAYTNVQWNTTNCLGNYKGTLNNGGERVTLSRSDGTQWVEVASIEYTDGGTADGEGASLELVHPVFASLRDQFYGAWSASTNATIGTNHVRYGGTPGSRNSVYNAKATPVVGDVIHQPPLPPAGSSVRITCKIGPGTFGSVDRVSLQWRWDALPQNAYSTLPMYDDGYNGDETAGDGTYTIMFPPYGYSAPTSGQILEFRISAGDPNGSMVVPAVSAANSGSFSYLCYFGEDTAYNGEYETYHMIMTTSNVAIVEAQTKDDDSVRVDGTVITSDGEIFYNCGIRHRGGTSTYSPYNYKIRFPAGRDLDGLQSMDLNHLSAMYQYMGMKIMGGIGYGVEAPKVKLCRLWLNSTDKSSQAIYDTSGAVINHKMYVRHEPVDQDLAQEHYGSDNGNFYFTDGDFYNGNLEYYSTNIEDYKRSGQQNGYNADTNNPSTAWHDLTNMLQIISQAPSTFVTSLTNRIDPREWARYFAGQMALDNGETGVNCPPGAPTDELRLYSGSENGIFHILPHDCDAILGGSSSDVWSWSGYNNADIINNQPAIKFYRHDCIDIATNTMSDAKMNAMFDEMGSAANGFRGSWLTNIHAQCAQIISILGARDAGPTAPTNMVLTNVTALSVELKWQDVGSDEEWFEIWRSLDGTSWKYRTYVEANVTSYIDRGLNENGTYFYKVRAADQNGESAFTAVTNVTTPFLVSDALLRNYLRVTEIMYNPTNLQSYEFIELMNTHAGQGLDLSGAYFTSGEPFSDQFVFTNGTVLGPGNFLVLVGDAAAFTSRYPGVEYYGQYTGGMGNNGEQIRIRASNTATVIDFTYGDWYAAADGQGKSLVLWDPAGTTNNPTSTVAFDRMEHASLWRPSTYMYGSPGSNDPAPPFGAITINEVLSHQDQEDPGDWIELYNPTTNTVDIGYWRLSDDAGNLMKYRIPPGTSIGPGGYALFNEYWNFGTNSFAGWTNGFGLSELGDVLYLSSCDSNGFTGYRKSVDFGAADRDVTFGRHTRSDGETDFVAMSGATSNGANAYPAVGPIVISEIMYDPPAGGSEYVELFNITSSNIPLFDVSNPSNTWRFDGAMEYTFPTNVYVGPFQHLLVVGIATNEFMTTYGLTGPAFQVFGPYDGDLANEGESVKLYKPGSPETNGYVPMVRVDRVQYDNVLPWPVGAANGGASLERITQSAYGNDPTNWMAGTMFGTPCRTNNAGGLPAVNFATTGGSGMESGGNAQVLVTMTPAPTNNVSVWFTTDGGTATENVDYIPSNGVVAFAAGQTSNTITLVVSNDVIQEPDETVLVTLTSVDSSVWLGGNTRFTWTIVDNDGAVQRPTISPAGTNYFTNYVSVSIATNGLTSAIFYTTDGSIPDSGDNIYTGAFTLVTSARVVAKAYFGSYMTSMWTTALFIERTGPWEQDPNLHEVRVSHSSDDAYEQVPGVGSMSRVFTTKLYTPVGRTNDLDKSYDLPWAGVRFTNLNIDSSMRITNAFIQFYIFREDATNTSVRIMGHQTNNAPVFLTVNTNISLRPRTTNYVMWTTTASEMWSPTGYAGAYQRTPCLTNIINEVIARPGWTSGNAIAFIFSNGISGEKRASSYDAGTNYAPILRYWVAPPAYWLGVYTNGPGTITGGNLWAEPGSNVLVSALPDAHYQFGGWTGSVDGVDASSNVIHVVMTNNRMLWGHFADILWTNGAAEGWLDYYYPGTNDYNNAALSDTDGDGHAAWQEQIAGTIPTNRESVFRISAMRQDMSGSSVSWPSVTGRIYSIYKSTNIMDDWPGSPYTNNLTSPTNGTRTWTDEVTNNPAFYQLNVQ